MKKIDLQRLLDSVPEDAELMVNDMDGDVSENIRLIYTAVYRTDEDPPGIWKDESWRDGETERFVYYIAAG